MSTLYSLYRNMTLYAQNIMESLKQFKIDIYRKFLAIPMYT